MHEDGEQLGREGTWRLRPTGAQGMIAGAGMIRRIEGETGLSRV